MGCCQSNADQILEHEIQAIQDGADHQLDHRSLINLRAWSLSGCPQILETFDAKGRRRNRPDILKNILTGKVSKEEGNIVRSRIHLARWTFDFSTRDLFIQGLQKHKWLLIEEVSICRCALLGNHLDGLARAIRDHPCIMKLSFKVQVQVDVDVEALVELMRHHQKLTVFDLTESSFWRVPETSPNISSFVDTAVHHPTLQSIMLPNSYQTLDDRMASDFFHALSSSESNLKHLDISSFSGIGVLGMDELIKCLPKLGSLDTLHTKHISFHRSNGSKRSLTFLLHHVDFLDLLYYRLNMLEDNLPKALWPLLGYINETIDGVEIGPYLSKKVQVTNQLILSGLLPTAPTIESSRLLLPDWKEFWQQPLLVGEREKFILRFRYLQRQLLEIPTSRQDNRFKATAIFLIVRECLVTTPTWK